MPTTRFTVRTGPSPSAVITLVTDFGPDRADRCPNVDEAHFTVHERGPAAAGATGSSRPSEAPTWRSR
jgi:hypothetical protein